jgi:hypothetical protein
MLGLFLFFPLRAWAPASLLAQSVASIPAIEAPASPVLLLPPPQALPLRDLPATAVPKACPRLERQAARTLIKRERSRERAKAAVGFRRLLAEFAPQKDLTREELRESMLRSVDRATPEELAKDREDELARLEERLREFFDRSRGKPPLNEAPPPIEGLSGVKLLAALHENLKRTQRPMHYLTAMSFVFSTADNQELYRRVPGVVDAYSGLFLPGRSGRGKDYGNAGDANGDGLPDKGMDVEHVWPQIFFRRSLPMRSDVHILMATLSLLNGLRGNLPFGEVYEPSAYFNARGARSDGKLFEPPDFTKGRVARALLYFLVRYFDEEIFYKAPPSFWSGSVDMFLRWNREHPPDPFERRRNDLAEVFQGNRNPFIDDPSLADRIGARVLRRFGPQPSLKAKGPSLPKP